MNKVILLGRMARDPEVRFTQGNEPMAVCRFAVAVDRHILLVVLKAMQQLILSTVYVSVSVAKV